MAWAVVLKFLLRPSVIAFVGASVLLAFVVGYHRQTVRNAYEAGHMAGAQMVRDEVSAAQRKAADVAHGASTDLGAKDAKARVVYRNITQQVDRLVAGDPVYLTSCLDDAGLRLANAAIAGADPAAGKPDAAVP